MKINEKTQQIQSINQSFSELRWISPTLVFAIIMTFLALSGKAANVLVNPGFDSAPLFAPGSWTQHSSQTWSSGAASSADPTPAADKLIHSGANGLWFQGVYSGAPQDQYVSQTFSCTPGNTYTADAWYSAYTYCSSHIGGDDGSDPANAFTYPVGSGVGGGSGLYGTDGSGNEDGWVEVKFYNSGNVVIGDFKSAIVDSTLTGTASTTTLPLATNALGNINLAWMDFPVTNQYDPTTVLPNNDPDTDVAGITNTLGSGHFITAPPGAVTVEFGIHLFQAQYEAGAPFWDDATLSQVGGVSASAIANLSPDGTKFFNGASTSFTFNVVSQSQGGAPLATNATSSVGIVVNGVNKTGSLQFSGPSTNLAVTLPGLTTNTLYTISMSVTNSAGLTSFKNVNFDTFATNYFIVRSEDYDFTNGLFIQNSIPTVAPATNSYTGLAGILGVDESTYNGTGVLPGLGAAQLVRSDNNVAFEQATDLQLPLYLAQNNPDVYNVQLSYQGAGNWENYTRVYPTGNYLIYARLNSTGSAIEYLNLLTSGYGTATQTTNNLGGFFTPTGTASSYEWIPLTDTFGNSIIVNLPAGTNTLQLLSGPGSGDNFVDFMFVPAGTGFPPVINNLSPNNLNPPVNANIFLNVTNITFSVGSAFSTVATNKIHTLANGVDISSSATYTGNNTNWNVSIPCPQNQLITLLINVTDANGLSNSVTETFDTFSQNNLMIEAVDFDFNGGQFIDNPLPTAGVNTATNSYFDGGFNAAGGDGTNMAVQNVDYNGSSDGGGEAWQYRQLDRGVGQEVTTDFKRDKFINVDGNGDNAQDYDIGYWNGGFWENYTRTFPVNKFNVYARMAGGNGPFNNTTLALVTSGKGTTTQTTQLLGSFADPNAAAWTTWHWVPMLDTNGNLATVTLGGVQTLKLTSGNNANAHFLIFVASLSANLTVSISGSNIQLHFPTQTGHTYTVLYKNSLTVGSWQSLSAAVPGDDTVKTVSDIVGLSQRFYKLQIQ